MKRSPFIIDCNNAGPSVAWPALKLTLTQAASAIWCMSNQRGVILCLQNDHTHFYCMCTLCMRTPFSISTPGALSLISKVTLTEVGKKMQMVLLSWVEFFKEQHLRSTMAERRLSSKQEMWKPVLLFNNASGSTDAGHRQGWSRVGVVVVVWCGYDSPCSPSEVAHRRGFIHSWDLILWAGHELALINQSISRVWKAIYWNGTKD